MKVNAPVEAENVKSRAKTARARQRFAILEFTNRSGTPSFRVSGYRRDGGRIRENFAELARAQARQLELESEYVQQEPPAAAIRATRLTPEQLALFEVVAGRLGEDWPKLLDAVEYWTKHGKHNAVPESPRLDEAVKAYLDWLEKSDLRPATKASFKTRVRVFANGMPNLRVCDVGPDAIEKWLDSRKVGPISKETDRRTVSQFFGWAMERPRHWCAVNPCSAVKVNIPASGKPPEILTVAECEKLMRTAEKMDGGALVPYLATCLFAGLRPFGEARKLTWAQVNLTDNEIRLEGGQTKTGRPRVVSICPALKAWLEAYQGKPFFPPNAALALQRLKAKVRSTPMGKDVLRHTAISHYFRKTGSYGQTAEQFGNSEAIIKKHYQGRVSSADTERFYAIRPARA